MTRFGIALFLVAHGLVHGIMFALSYSEKAVSHMSFNPGYSWLLGSTRRLGLGLALLVAAAFVAAGAGYITRATWWPTFTVSAAVLSVALLALYHSKYWVVGYPISFAIAIFAWHAQATAATST